MRVVLAIVVAIGAAAALGACSGEGGAVIRYAYEKQGHDASLMEIRAFSEIPRDDVLAWEAAVQAYEATVQNNPLSSTGDSVELDVQVAADIRRVALSAKLGLLRLRFFDFRQHAAVTHDDYWFDPRERLFTLPGAYDGLGITEWYGHFQANPTRRECERLLRGVAADSVFWSSVGNAQDSVLVVPLAMLGAHVEGAPSQSFLAFVDSFYTRVAQSWPDHPAARRSLAYRAAAKSMAGRWQDAIADLDTLLALDRRVWGNDELLIMKGDALAHGLGLVDSGAAAYRSASQHPSSDEIRWSATLRLALLASLDRNGAPGSDAAFKQIHLHPRVPEWASAWAMWGRARYLRDHGLGDRAVEISWRLTQRHPYTVPALLSPLLIIEVVNDMGSDAELQTAAAKAGAFYDQLLARPSATLSPRYFVLDCVFELQRLLVRYSKGTEYFRSNELAWARDNRDIATFKRALFAEQLGDVTRDDYKHMLRVIERDEPSRYARAMRRSLDNLRAPDREDRP